MARTLASALAALAARIPDMPAIWYRDETISFAELDRRSRRVAAGLAALGVGRGDVVSLFLPNAPAWITAFFGLGRLGAIALATNTRFRRSEVSDVLGRARAKAVVFWRGFRGIDFEEILRESLPALPALESVIAYDEDAVAGAAAIDGRGVTPFAALGASVAPRAQDDAAPDSPCLLFTTSGTTRRPKLVVHTHRTLLAHAKDVAVGFEYGALDGAGTLEMLPLCGTYGISQGLATLFAGRPMVLHPLFDAAVAREAIRRRGIRRVAMTDEMVRRLYAGIEEKVPFPGLRFFTGTRAHELAPLSQERGFRVSGIYGSSEVQALFARQPDHDDPVRMAEGGGLPVCPRAEVRARDPETGRILSHGKPGELEIRAPSVTPGYLGDPEATARAFTEDGFFRTGDLGLTRADGSFRYITRIGEAFRLNGFLVNPVEIEEFIQEHPKVERCQIVGLERDGTTRVVAFVTARGGATLSEAALREHCLAGIARYKVPARFVALDAFPMVESANNRKIHRARLREMAAEVLGG
jgi:fatty-acyl-CoA synthase